MPAGIVILIAAGCAVILELSNFNVLGKAGGYLKAFQFGLFGIMGYALPVLIIAAAALYKLSGSGKTAKLICAVLIFLFAGAAVHQITSSAYEGAKIISYYATGYESLSGGGFICGLLGLGLFKAFGDTGVYIICGLVIVVCLLIILEFHRLLMSDEERRKKPEKEQTKKKEKQKEPVSAPSEEPDKKSKGLRSRYKQEQEVYKTEQEGKVIRIVHSSGGNKHKRAETRRSQNKAKSMREEKTSQVRSGAKVRGVSSDINLEKTMDKGDDLHEITNARPAKKKEEPQKPLVRRSVVEVRDVTDKEEQKQQGAEIACSKAERPIRNALHHAKASSFSLPPVSLLEKKKAASKNASEDIEKTSRTLEYVLEQFGVYAKVVNVQTGPAVTRYELMPEMGTRVSKFTSLADDLKLNLAVSDIRIEAPVPGKSVVGIEIPNKNVQPVTLRELLESDALSSSPSSLAFAAGRSISGEIITGDIASMPHLLIAGTTGSGKSVFTKSIIMELLYRTRPDEVGLIIIDPKKVEFNVFEGIPNLMKGVVTDPGQAVSTLRWAVNEMMIRYERMNKNGVNNIKSYNAKLERGQISEDEINPQKMPQIVIVIDELADLMMAAKKEVESYICRLAQLSRAAGIHMIIATQRPSADVVTGLIKSNIPSRVALKVASGIDSRVILDCMGAEKLLGKGDMLFYPNGYSAPVRVQGAYVTDKEVSDTVNYLISHKTGSYYADTEKEIEDFISTGGSGPSDENEQTRPGADKYDEYFHDAGLLCIEMGRASSSMLQRRFNLGFNRAARIIDQLSEFGAIGPANGSKPREILVDSMTFEEMYDEMMKE